MPGMRYRNRALVLSGSGSRAPYMIGALTKFHGSDRRYDYYCGVSGGALIAAFLSQYGEGEESAGLLAARKLFLGVTTRKILKIPGVLENLWMDSIYSSKPLRKLIKKHIDPEKVRSSGKKLRVGTVRMGRGDYRVFKETSPNILKAILASASVPVAFPNIQIGGDWYADGGIRTMTPVAEAVTAGATEIDVITSIPCAKADIDYEPGVFSTLMRTIEILTDEVTKDDLQLKVYCEKEYPNIKFRFFRPTHELVKNALVFRPKEAKYCYDRGYEDAKNNPDGM